MLAKVTLVKIVNNGTSVCDYIGGDVVAYISGNVESFVHVTDIAINRHINVSLIPLN